MKRIIMIGISLVMLTSLLVLFSCFLEEVQALPEYSAQTGEPCATCHVSPSGGGTRSPRGQAWIADGKPISVPELLTALELLGVKLDVDITDFNYTPVEIPPAQPLPLPPGPTNLLHHHLIAYPGN